MRRFVIVLVLCLVPAAISAAEDTSDAFLKGTQDFLAKRFLAEVGQGFLSRVSDSLCDNLDTRPLFPRLCRFNESQSNAQVASFSVMEEAFKEDLDQMPDRLRKLTWRKLLEAQGLVSDMALDLEAGIKRRFGALSTLRLINPYVDLLPAEERDRLLACIQTACEEAKLAGIWNKAAIELRAQFEDDAAAALANSVEKRNTGELLRDLAGVAKWLQVNPALAEGDDSEWLPTCLQKRTDDSCKDKDVAAAIKAIRKTLEAHLPSNVQTRKAVKEAAFGENCANTSSDGSAGIFDVLPSAVQAKLRNNWQCPDSLTGVADAIGAAVVVTYTEAQQEAWKKRDKLPKPLGWTQDWNRPALTLAYWETVKQLNDKIEPVRNELRDGNPAKIGIGCTPSPCVDQIKALIDRFNESKSLAKPALNIKQLIERYEQSRSRADQIERRLEEIESRIGATTSGQLSVAAICNDAARPDNLCSKRDAYIHRKQELENQARTLEPEARLAGLVLLYLQLEQARIYYERERNRMHDAISLYASNLPAQRAMLRNLEREARVKMFLLTSEYLTELRRQPDLLDGAVLLGRVAPMLYELSRSNDPEEVAATLEAFSSPVGAWRMKRTTSDWFFSLGALVGFAGGAERIYVTEGDDVKRIGSPYGAFVAGLFAPIGIDLSKADDSGGTNGIFLSVLDVGNVASVRFGSKSGKSDADPGTTATEYKEVETQPNLGFEQLIAPGIFYRHGFSDSAWVWGFGYSATPGLRVAKRVDTDETVDLDTDRFVLFVAVDIVMLPF